METPNMTLLDYFAGQALAGVMASIKPDEHMEPQHEAWYAAISYHCYEMAENMILTKKEVKKTNKIIWTNKQKNN